MLGVLAAHRAVFTQRESVLPFLFFELLVIFVVLSYITKGVADTAF